MRRFWIYLTIITVSLTTSIFSFSQEDLEAYEGKIISEVRVKGLINTNKDLVIGILTISKGDKFNYKTLTNNFKNLEALGFFENIFVEAVENDSGEIIITFRFDERAKVGAIAIEGEDEIEESEIISVMLLKPGNIYKDSDLIQDEQKILSLYKARGFEGTSVSVRARKGKNNKLANIIVQVNEGREVYIQSIRIIGTKTMDPDEISERMISQESDLLESAVLDPRKLKADRRNIEQYMRDNGYWLGRVNDIKIRKDFIEPDDPEDKEKGFFILVEIKEGPQFKMGDLKITGHTIFKDKEIYSQFKMKKGQIYNDTLFKKDLAKIRDMYFNRGYIQLQIIPTPRVDEKNKTLYWDVELVEGEKVHIKRIRITGHEKTKIWVIDRELRIFEGEIFNLKKIKKSVNKLKNTQYFSLANPLPVPTLDDGLVELQFKMTEQRTGLITVGAGFGTLSGFSVFEEVQEKNLYGYGWTLRERVEVGQRRLNVEVGTSTNWLFPYSPIIFSFTFRYIRDTVDAFFSLDQSFVQSGTLYTYKVEAFEVDFSFGKFLSDEWSIFTGYLISFSKAFQPRNFSLSNIDSSTIRGSSLFTDLTAGLSGNYLAKISQRFGFTYDSRDLTLNTRNGWKIRGIFKYTGGVYSGDSQWLKWENNYAYYVNPFWDLVFAFFASYEILFNQFNGGFEIRDVDRLRFDGLNELRGWRTIRRDEIVGQGGKVSFINEIRFPIFEEMLWAVLFADAGDVTDSTGSLPSQLRYYSFGFGFRLQIPLIPIRLYFAKKADYNVSRSNKFFLYDGIQVVFTVGGFF